MFAFVRRYPVLRTSTPEEWRHHVARGQESNHHRRHARIGYAIACRFIEEGATVTVFGSRQETADAAVEKLTAIYPNAKVWGRSCDLTSLEAVTEAFTQLQPIWRSRYGRQQRRNLPALTPFGLYTEEFAKVMDLNVVAVFNGHQLPPRS